VANNDRIRVRAGGLVLVLASLAVTACGGELKENILPTLEDVINSVTTLNGSTRGSLVAGDRPAASGGPASSISGVNTAINGGSLPITVTSSTAFDRVVISAEGLDNYYTLDLPSAATSVDLILGVSTEAMPTSGLNLRYGVAVSSQLGAFATQSVRILRVATGDVQVSVSWDTPSDVDLHVTDPNGDEVYFANTTVASGGTLDLDSNPACSIDGVNNENIVWPTGSAPNGTYTVGLDYWSDCGVPETNWVVTIQSKGQAPQVFSGTFTGASGGGVDIPDLATFTR